MISKKLFKESFFLVLIIAVINWWALDKNIYWSIREFDSMMHFLGGAWVALSFIFIYHYSGWFDPGQVTFGKFIFIALLGTFFVSVVWEIYELATGTTMANWADYPHDTALDFVMDGLGAVAASMYAFSREVVSEKNLRNKEEKNGEV